MSVNRRVQLRTAFAEIITRLNASDGQITVRVGNVAYEQDLRTQLSLAVGREEITEDRYRDVVFSLNEPPVAPAPQNIPEPPVATIEKPKRKRTRKKTRKKTARQPSKTAPIVEEVEIAAIEPAPVKFGITPTPSAENYDDDDDPFGVEESIESIAGDSQR